MNRKSMLKVMSALTVACVIATPAWSQNTNAQGTESHKHSMDMQHRGDEGMGFSQAKTTHHFILTKDGGVISVDANDAKDTASRDQIRMHLAHIAKMFGEGNFDIPMFVHDQVPPGVPVMKSKKEQIRYRFEEANLGGRVVITGSDAEALSAVHDFLSFQIREHKTADSLTVQ
jgi:hypothetical protein